MNEDLIIKEVFGFYVQLQQRQLSPESLIAFLLIRIIKSNSTDIIGSSNEGFFCRNIVYCHSVLILLEFERTILGGSFSFSLVFLCLAYWFLGNNILTFSFKILLYSSFS